MKNFILIIVFLITCDVKAQNSGSITVGGDLDKFYPTVWTDGGWNSNVASQLEIGRSSTHENTVWRGSLIASFVFHTTVWGNGAQFIDANIIQNHNVLVGENMDFIGGWKDASSGNGNPSIIIWLKGGGITYHYKSLYSTTCAIFDGVVNPLPYQEENGPDHTYKTAADKYVNSNGLSKDGTAYFNGNTTNYFAGNVGVGTPDTKGYKLAVAGNFIAESVKVQLQSGWADYVFETDYKLQSLKEVERFIKKNKHLPEIPSAELVKINGIDLGEMNVKLLKKIEELTLHLIDQDKKLDSLIIHLSKKDNEIKRLVTNPVIRK